MAGRKYHSKMPTGGTGRNAGHGAGPSPIGRREKLTLYEETRFQGREKQFMESSKKGWNGPDLKAMEKKLFDLKKMVETPTGKVLYVSELKRQLKLFREKAKDYNGRQQCGQNLVNVLRELIRLSIMSPEAETTAKIEERLVWEKELRDL